MDDSRLGWPTNTVGRCAVLRKARGAPRGAARALEEGPTGALVDRVATDWGAASGQFHSFHVRGGAIGATDRWPVRRAAAGTGGLFPPGPSDSIVVRDGDQLIARYHTLYRAIGSCRELELAGERVRAARLRTDATDAYCERGTNVHADDWRRSFGARSARPMPSGRADAPAARSPRRGARWPRGSADGPPDPDVTHATDRLTPGPVGRGADPRDDDDVLERALDAYTRLAESGEEVEDEWSYIQDLTEAWEARLQEVRTARSGERAEAVAAVDAAMRRDRPDRGCASGVDWLSTFPQVTLIALGEPT